MSNADQQQSSTTAASVSAPNVVTEQQKRRNIAQLLVNFGVAEEQDVFFETYRNSRPLVEQQNPSAASSSTPSSSSADGSSVVASPSPSSRVSLSDPTLFRSTSRRASMPPMLRGRWYLPWTWFRRESPLNGGAPHVNPMLLSASDVTKELADLVHADKQQAPLLAAEVVSDRVVAADAPVKHALSSDASAADAGAAKVEEPQHHAVTSAVAAIAASAPRNPPPLHFKALSDSDVSLLQPSTRDDRMKLLKLEDSTHQMLENLERTKIKYLTPSKALRCEEEVDAVIACYGRLNMQMSSMDSGNSNSNPSKSQKQKGQQGPTSSSITTTQRGKWILNCGSAVDRLDACTRAILDEYATAT